MRQVAAFMLFCVPYLPMAAGCVSKSTHLDTVAQLEEARKVGLKHADALEAFKKQASADAESKVRQLTQQINGLNQEKTRLAAELSKAHEELAREQQDRQSAQREVGSERGRQQNLAKQFEQAQAEHQRLGQTNAELDQERNRLQSTADALHGQVDDLRQQIASAKSELVNADARHAALKNEKDQLAADLDGARNRGKELSDQLTVQQQTAGTLREDKERLLAAITPAQEELARLQKRNGDVESQLSKQLSDRDREIAELKQVAADRDALKGQVATLSDDIEQHRQKTAALSGNLDALKTEADRHKQERDRLAAELQQHQKQLSARDQEIDRLKQASADRDALKGQVAALSNDIEHHRQRAATVSGNLDALEAEAERLRQERDRLAADLNQHQDLLKAAEPKLASLHSTVSERDQELERLRHDQDRLQALLKQEQERLRQEAADKQRLEQERAAKDAEIQRLTKTHEDLTKSLKDDIEKGNITIKQVRDQLTINMVDRVLFDSGKAEIKPAGIKVLKQVGDVLKHVTDKQIRIEGHTDNVPIGPKIKDRFPTNWELSTARATSVIRYLIEDGGVERTAISAGGYADTRPGASNENEEGRASNRRIEIVLYPKDLGAIASQIAQ